MPKRKGTRTQTRKTSTKRAERRLPEINLSKSYTSLAYGVLTVLVLFLLIYAGVKIFSHQAPSIGNNGVNTQKTVSENASNREYVVKAGDNLWSISEKEYGTGYNWSLIAKANNLNNPGEIEKGQKLTIPSAPKAVSSNTVTQAPSAAPTKVAQKTISTPTSTPVSTSGKTALVNGELRGEIKGNTYTVQKGDYLWEIAQRVYGDPYRWVDIAKANDLSNPDLIYSGNVFRLPRP